MDLAFLLGTIVTENRRKAKAIGYVFHFLLGLAFALMYVEFFELVGRSSWWVGALLGALQAVFTATVLVNELLPVIHPRMATTDTAANRIRAHRAARIPDAELRPQHISRDAGRAHRVRGHHRRARECRDRNATTKTRRHESHILFFFVFSCFRGWPLYAVMIDVRVSASNHWLGRLPVVRFARRRP